MCSVCHASSTSPIIVARVIVTPQAPDEKWQNKDLGIRIVA
jgi:hypothetical protein